MKDIVSRVPEHMRNAYEATDAVIVQIEGLVAALDVIENEIRLPDEQRPQAKAFRMIRPLLTEKVAALCELREAEWKAIGGN